MNAILYLARKQVRNFLLDLLHHPAKLIMYLGTAAAVVLMFVATLNDPPKQTQLADLRILEGGYLVLLLFSLVSTLLSGLKSASQVFEMRDVNFLFPSPLSPKKVLAYGVVKQMLSLLLSQFFLLYYTSTLTRNFGISTWSAAGLIVAFVLQLFILQVVSLLIYSYANSTPARRNIAKGIVWAVPVFALLIAGSVFAQNGGGMEAAMRAVSSPALDFLPVAGWVKGAVFSFSAGAFGRFAVFASLLSVFFVLSLVCYAKSNPDYYEDALQKAETVFEVKQAVKENRAFSASDNEKIKVRKTGIGKGWGANTFFYKHLCETRRKNRFAFVRLSTLVLLAANLALVFFIRYLGNTEGDSVSPSVVMAVATSVSIYLLFFLNAAGDWSRELMKPYLYLAPEKPFQKLVWACMTTLVKPVMDGFIVFSVAALAAGANFPTGAICVLLYASAGIYFTAFSVLAQRVLGGMESKGLLLILYMILLILIASPGIAGGILFILFGNPPAGLSVFLFGLPVVFWNLFASAVIFYACRNLLSTAEMD